MPGQPSTRSVYHEQVKNGLQAEEVEVLSADWRGREPRPDSRATTRSHRERIPGDTPPPGVPRSVSEGQPSHADTNTRRNHRPEDVAARSSEPFQRERWA